MLLCRGCCCGTTKHPLVDHDHQARRLEDAVRAQGTGRLHRVDCLGPCERSNVVVVRRGATRHWFGDVLDAPVTDALAQWIRGGAVGAPPPAMAQRQFDPAVSQPQFAVRRWARRDHLGVAALAVGLLGQGIGVWTVGVVGAVAELSAAPGATAVDREATTVTATFGDGALRLDLGDDVDAFVVSPPDGPGPVVAVIFARPAAAAVSHAGGAGLRLEHADHDAVRPADRPLLRFDLGLDRPECRFCVRSGDPALLATLTALSDRRAPWPELVEEAGALLMDPVRSPHRIVLTPGGRGEVWSPIPSPDASSPPGSHTHLLAGELELGRTLALGVDLPAGWVPIATFHPPLDWIAPVELAAVAS